MEITTNKKILSVNNLKKYFRVSSGVVKAVDGISFDLNEGEILGLIGESGSGKTTVGRSLIRLYDDYSGIVTMDDKIISGKRISKANNKFLRRNMQMIFQDPHTSLNGQHNIFSILKEPLVVNGILKDQYKNLFSDWNQIIRHFKYTLKRDMLKSELLIYQHKNPLIAEFQKKWLKKLHSFNFDQNQSHDDIFNRISKFYEDKQSLMNQMINMTYKQIELLENSYLKYQKQYRNNDLLIDEKNLKEAEQKYLLTKKLQKQSTKKVEMEAKIKTANDKYKNLLKFKREYSNRSLNIVKNYIYEYKTDYKYFDNNRISSKEFKQYNFNVKQKYLTLKIISELKTHQKNLNYLSVKTLSNLIDSLSNYFSEQLAVIKSNDKKYDDTNIKLQINKNWSFDFSSYLTENAKHLNKVTTEISKAKSDIAQMKEKYKSMSAPEPTPEKLEEVTQLLNVAKAEFAKETKAFEDKYLERFKQLDVSIESQKKTFENFAKDEKEIDDLLKKTYRKFFENIKSNSSDKKEVKNTINNYKTTLSAKMDTMKSYEMEIRILSKDIDKIKHYFGIKKDPFSKLHIKQIELRKLIYKSLEDVGLLRQFAYRYPHEFSGGQRQRIVIARALISNPKVIVADEPIASLDISIQAQVVNLLKDLCRKRGFALVFIAHDLSMVEYIADKIHIMHLGKIVEEGETREIYKNPLHPYTNNLFDSIPKLSNANIPFRASNFNLEYLAEQRFPNVAKMYEVNAEHNLFATEEQFKRWTSVNNEAEA
ncbi:oligopeptide transport system ATP-binding protein [Mycoplasma testudineum]|uniref:Oligopeptide transport system ATP-binding protein n=1 Tax=Mycoplasma testudineum TaxID=244584 RepID=A0A4R6IDL3_9MOLU|nr:ATP-binding cassette domain-containing protein [Mycoplasma testudineum]OYD26826.1 peptide ABC transporter ATP-binding protein [Mycoplasma testudineum]TDO20360.1 oligopeptide transport system ATP-binding protein [Mycoplasma testudineum]